MESSGHLGAAGSSVEQRSRSRAPHSAAPRPLPRQLLPPRSLPGTPGEELRGDLSGPWSGSPRGVRATRARAGLGQPFPARKVRPSPET